MGICRVRLRRCNRYIQARHHSWHATARERRQVWLCLSHDCEGTRLRFYGVRKALNKVSRCISRSKGGQAAEVSDNNLMVIAGARQASTFTALLRAANESANAM